MTARTAATILLLSVTLFTLLTGLGACGEEEAVGPAPVAREDFTGQVLYQINVPEFSEAGTLTGATAHLDEVAALGVKALVLNPIHPAGSARGDSVPPHPYAVRDHLAVDPRLGDLEDFEAFVAAAHERGLLVLLDMVLNHGGLDHVARADHPEFFRVDAQGRPTRKVAAWKTAVDFDHDHAGARDYLHRVLRTWARRGVDGFRCLHANLQDGDFWTGALAAARRVRPGLVFVADSKDPRHLAEGFDAVARPQFLETSSFAFLDDVAQRALNDGMWLAVVDTVFDTAGHGVIFLEDRFTRRATEAFPWPRGAGYAAALLTLPGHPQLYNGQEWGCRQQARLAGPSPLDRTVRHAGWEALYRDLLRLRAASEAVRRGESRRVPASNREILVYVRELPQETVLVAVNLSGSGPQFALPDDLAARRWRPWRDGAFGEPRALAGPVDLEPFGWRAWRAAD